ncbi:MAG TPA: radical SAM protein [Bacillota bacterium]|nr:radical SAM protein [Bacillota bacterium]HPL53220.1 radical SAM protein [Bacillota bacterium]
MNRETQGIIPLYVFQYGGIHYAIDIEKMQANVVDDLTAEYPGRVSPELERPLPSDPEENLKKKKQERTSIITMALFVTRACNLQCSYCYEKKINNSMEEKTAFQAVDWLLRQSGDMKKIYISFFGGEPFLNFPLIKKVAAYAREAAGNLDKTVGFSVTTNATLLNDETISFLREYDVNVLVSMDGPREIHDKQRPFADGHGSYDTIMPRVKKLLEVKPDTCAHAVLVDDSKSELVKSSLKNIGFREVTLLPASPSLFEEEKKTGKVKHARKLDGLLRELERETELWLKLVKNRDKESLKDLRSRAQLSQALLSLLHNKKLRYACGAGIKFIAVSCEGDIYLCHRFVGLENYKLGNIFKTGLKENYRESPLTRVPSCAACFARYYCAGGCKHDNAGSCGSAWTSSEEICRLRRRELELAAVLVSQFNDQDRAFLNEYEIFPPKPCPLDF